MNKKNIVAPEEPVILPGVDGHAYLEPLVALYNIFNFKAVPKVCIVRITISFCIADLSFSYYAYSDQKCNVQNQKRSKLRVACDFLPGMYSCSMRSMPNSGKGTGPGE